jgi:hypothetical protein
MATDISQGLDAISQWLQREDDELLYSPDTGYVVNPALSPTELRNMTHAIRAARTIKHVIAPDGGILLDIVEQER